LGWIGGSAHQDFNSDHALKIGHRSNLVTAIFASDVGRIDYVFVQTEAVPATFAAIEFDRQPVIQSNES